MAGNHIELENTAYSGGPDIVWDIPLPLVRGTAVDSPTVEASVENKLVTVVKHKPKHLLQQRAHLRKQLEHSGSKLLPAYIVREVIAARTGPGRGPGGLEIDHPAPMARSALGTG